MKKLTRLMAITASLGVIMSSVPYSTSAYDYQGDFTLNEILDSEVKPKITIESECISIDEAMANPARTINVSVEGANFKYCSTGFHIYYDRRLKLLTNRAGLPYVKKGDAWQDIITMSTLDDPTAAEHAMKGFFISSTNNVDSGLDGVMFSFELYLPNDAQPGDVYPINIIYKSNPNAEDLFTNKANDKAGQLMQAYAFTYGIYNGTTSNFVPEEEDLQRCEKLYDIDPSHDGYIAIADNVTTTTTRTTTTTTTTTRPTTTTTTTTTATQSLIIVPSEVSMSAGDTNKLAVAGASNLSDVMWTSGNTSVATVDENGKVTAKNAGNVEIYAVCNGAVASCHIEVSDPDIVYGDANEDNKVNIADAASIIQHIGNQDDFGLSPKGLTNADTNGDGLVTGIDSIIIQEISAGIHSIDELPLKD